MLNSFFRYLHSVTQLINLHPKLGVGHSLEIGGMWWWSDEAPPPHPLALIPKFIPDRLVIYTVIMAV
jgi:hypothetical protein